MSAGPRLLAPGRRPPLRAASPVPWPRALGMRLAPLLQATRLDELQGQVARLAEEIAEGHDAFVLLVDAGSTSVDAASARGVRGLPVRPAALRRWLGADSVLARLRQGLHIQHAEKDADTHLLLPLMHDSSLHAVLGVSVPFATRPLGRVLEPLRDLSLQCAPLLARLRDIEELRRMVGSLTTLVFQGEQCETRARAAEAEVLTGRVQSMMGSHLMANVNHALRTPLVAIRGYTRLLLEDGASTLTADQRQYLEVVSRNAERLVDVAGNLMVPSGVRLQLMSVELRDLWRNASGPARAVATGRGVGMAERLPDAPVSLIADEPRLRQMLSELLHAALEAAAAGDELRLELVDEAHRVVLTLVNARPASTATSEGAPKDPPRLPAGGSLRLDTVREIANLHGGRFGIARDDARGCVFSIVLPRVRLEV
jgi:signal transduction histidine kinase